MVRGGRDKVADRNNTQSVYNECVLFVLRSVNNIHLQLMLLYQILFNSV